MTNQTDPQDHPEIQTADSLTAAIRVGVEIAASSTLTESERMVIERIIERFCSRQSAEFARYNTLAIRLIENTVAIRELKESVEANRRNYERIILWLSIGIAAEGALLTILAIAILCN